MTVLPGSPWLVLALACGEPAPDRPGPAPPQTVATDTDAGPDPDPDPDPDIHTGTAAPSGDTGLPETGAPADSRVDSAHTGDTAPPTADTGRAGTLDASCALAVDNSLRAWCDIEVWPPQPVEVSFQPVAGGAERVHRSDGPLPSHRVGLYVMSAETAYGWVARAVNDPSLDAAGTVTTGALPDGARLEVTLGGQASFQHFLHTSPCADDRLALVTATAGDVVWYQAFMPDKLRALQWTEDDTVLALVAGAIREVDWMGQPALELDQGVDYVEFSHHDLFRRAGYTYALFNETVPLDGNDYRLDGFNVFDAGGSQVAAWRLRDHWLPPGPDPKHDLDVSHGNSIWVGDDGLAVLSFRHMSTVIQVRADPADADFGDVVWRLEGNPDDAEWVSDFQFVLPGLNGTFKEQHHATLLPHGNLSLFDNRDDNNEKSRGLEIALDLQAGTAEIVHLYQIPAHCSFQGGAERAPSGNPVYTCAPRGEGHEFEAVSHDLLWSIGLDCADGEKFEAVPRLIPLPW